MDPERRQLVIVGAGPAGLAAAAQAQANGLDSVLLERADHLADTIFCYQKRKHVMAEPAQIPARSGVPFSAGSREALLAAWTRHAEDARLNVRLRTELLGLERGGAGFLVRTTNGDLEAERVVLAIGTQGTPRGLGAPGEDLPHVAKRLVDPDDFVDRAIVVVGAGDSALEVALALCERNRVFLVVRRPEIVRAKEALTKDLARREASGQLEVLYGTTVRRILPAAIELKGAQQDSTLQCDQVFLKIGTLLPRALIEGFGVEFAAPEDDARPVLTGSYECSVPGLYLIGAVTGRDLIRLCMNQGFEVVEHILGRPVEPADEEVLKRRLPFWEGTVQQRILSLMDEVPLIGAAAVRAAPAAAGSAGGERPLRREPAAEQLREHLLAAEPRTFQRGEVILRQDEYTQSVMLLVDGAVEVVRREGSGEESTLAQLPAGTFFGEMGLISGRRRNASCVAAAATRVLEIPRKTMLRYLSSAPAAKRMMDDTFLLRSLRNYFPPEIPIGALWQLAGAAKAVPYEKEQVVFRELDPGDGMYLVRSGQVKLSKRSGDRELVLTYLVAGMFLGERALLGADPRPVTATTIFPSELVKLARPDLDAFLGRFPGLRPILERRLASQRMATLTEEATPGAGVVLSELIRENVVMGTDALLIDENKCIRCSNCVRACEDAHADGQARLSLTGVKFANVLAPNSCWQCEDPLCMLDCPPDALYRDARGEIHVRDNCIGCGNCASNCPYGNIFMVHPKPERSLLGWVKGLFGGEAPAASGAAGRTVAVKCDLCSSLPSGPACVRGCPTGAAIRVQPADYQATVARLMRVGSA
jgi:CRP-like cAMP-binding protein/thioredoxin reductase/Fe-S-cluster-containing hydrogenase component 2